MAGLLDRDALGQRRSLGRQPGIDPLQHAVHRRIERRLDADDLDLRRQRLGGDGDAGNQPAAADRHDQQVEIGASGQHFERDRSLPGDDRGVVIGVHQDEAALARQLVGGAAGVDQAVAAQHDLGAERLGAVDLGERRPRRHHDRRRDAEAARVVGDALRVVAGRHRDDAGAAFLRRRGSTAC